MLVHGAAGVVQAHQHLVALARLLQQGRDGLAQAAHLAGEQVTMEVQHEQARALGGLRLGPSLVGFLLRLGPALVCLGRQGRALEAVRHVLVAVVEVGDLEPTTVDLVPALMART